jgi:hypothetical protein
MTTTITFRNADEATWLANLSHLIGNGHRPKANGDTVTISRDAIEWLGDLTDEDDGYYDGRDVWIGGYPYRPITTAEVNVVTGELTIETPAVDETGALSDRRELEPWGAEEESMDRATEALRGLGYVMVDPTWRESAFADHRSARVVYAPDWVATADPVGATEIAQRMHVDRDTITTWRSRHSDFPPPRWPSVAGRPAWDWSRDIIPWLAKTGRTSQFTHPW